MTYNPSGGQGPQGIQGVKGDTGAQGPPGNDGSIDACWPVGSVFLSVVSTDPSTLLGVGTWTGIGAGRVLVGVDPMDTDFDTVEETGGSKTVTSTGTVSAPTLSGSTAAEASHTHSVTSNVAVADHASHTHDYTDVVNHVHNQAWTPRAQGGTTGSTTGTHLMTSAATGGNLRNAAEAIAAADTANPTGGKATGTTQGPSATLTHNVTNNAITSGAGSSHLHAVGTLAASAPTYTGNATSVVQPYLTVYMWKRVA